MIWKYCNGGIKKEIWQFVSVKSSLIVTYDNIKHTLHYLMSTLKDVFVKLPMKLRYGYMITYTNTTARYRLLVPWSWKAMRIIPQSTHKSKIKSVSCPGLKLWKGAHVCNTFHNTYFITYMGKVIWRLKSRISKCGILYTFGYFHFFDSESNTKPVF